MYLMDPVTIVLYIFTCALLTLYARKKNVHRMFPPGPPSFPIIGNMHIVSMEKPYVTFLELSEKYGPVYSLQIGTKKMVVLCGYETVRDALVNHAEEFACRFNVPVFIDISQEHGLIFSNGNTWKVMKRFALSALRDLGMGKKTIEEKIIEECKNLVQNLKAYNETQFENTSIINAAVANIIVSILMGHRFEYTDPKLQRLMNIINENIRIMGCPMVFLYNAFPSLVRWLPGSHQKVMPNLKELHAFIREIFTNQKEQLDVNHQGNLIEVFLVKQKEVFFSDENLTTLITDLFAAGMDTTSATLRWSLLLMMKYPEIQKNVQNEIQKVIGLGEPQAMHRKQMPYTDAVIHETQRFGNIVPMNIPHATCQDVTFKGYFIPKGTQVIPLLYSVLRDKKYFEKPEEFYPQHFLDSKGNFVKNEAFMPFSAGKRRCAGETLAKMELFLFFTTLLQSFTFQAPPGAKLDLTGDIGFTTHPLKYEMCAIPRN